MAANFKIKMAFFNLVNGKHDNASRSFVQGVDDNPFDFETVKKNISEALEKYKNRFKISLVPNITNICYGRGVGYKIEEIVLDEKTQQISATKIREQMRKEGKLK